MLSAAEDIMTKQGGGGAHEQHDGSSEVCLANITSRDCTKKSTGAVLLADILPSLIIKLTFPFFMQKIPFGFRHALVVLLQAASYLVVAFSETYAMSLAGVVLASIGKGVGVISYLSLTSYFPNYTIAAWSSGTGGAGIAGAFIYAALTEPHMGDLSPKNALLIMLVIPILFSFAYWVVLDCPTTVYTPSLHPTTWLTPANFEPAISTSSKESDTQYGEHIKQRETTFLEKLKLIRPLSKYMVPLSLVYFAESLINQGLVLYQVGVFISRSSISIFQLPMTVLYLLPLLQLTNAAFFAFDAMYAFVPHIGIIFALILIEGLYGGSSFVNTFNYIHKQIEPDVREYSLSIASMGDCLGIVLAALGGIQLHNSICTFQE